MPVQTDRELIAAAAQGQAAAFATLVGRYRDVRTRFALRMLGDYETADEALQAAFVRAFQSIGRCKDPDHFQDWLFRIVINECRARALRTVVRRRQTGEFAAVPDKVDAKPDTRAGSDVQRVLAQIDPINREAFILQYVEELTYPEIASLTGASVVTLERQVDRACARLRELLPQWSAEQRETTLAGSPTFADVEPSFAVRVASPLRRAEVLNDSFEDRLMARLLRPGAIDDATAIKPVHAPAHTAPMFAASAELPSGVSGANLQGLMSRLGQVPSFSRIARLGIAVGAVAVAFGTGFVLRGRRNSISAATAAAKPRGAASARVVRRSDTVRVAKSDTVVFARFVLSDANARSVAVVGDFNRWDAEATPLTRLGAGSWVATLRLKPARYEYAFLVDGKRWVTDRFARTEHDEFDTQSSILTAGSGPHDAGDRAATRIKNLLARKDAERVLATLATARSHGLPAAALENRVLKFSAKHVAAKDIEHAIAGEAARMERAGALLVSADRRDPSGGEIDAGAELLRSGGDSLSVGDLARAAPANRSLDVPLRVSAALVSANVTAQEAVGKVKARLRDGATDAQLEHLLDEPTRVASQTRTTGKDAHLAKTASSGGVRQAGAPAKSRAPTKPRHKSSDR
ncbi:MAG TPA: sigma-70 family RNA polymerase sigma factor [Gemmatimonadaceae bacterium]|nr:sigma-70 family RNA polymerase sigma factor [Gemmatimonadaceae bacterium]